MALQVKDIISFVENWRENNGIANNVQLSDSQIIKFVSELQYKNMQALARNNGEHLSAHKGNYQNGTSWYYDAENGNYHKLS